MIRDLPLRASAALLAIALAGCGTTAKRGSPAPAARAPDSQAPDAAKTPSRPATPRGGGYYLNDGPGDNPPPNLEQIPDAVPKREPLHRGAMRPYNVMGQNYPPMTQLAPYKARGTATWYGRRYHGQKTSSGEVYDMYQMTAAHTTLPIPSFARITNLVSNRSVVVRINDRGPFHSDRLIDLSYTAAYKLGLLGGGRALVEVETILPDATTPVAGRGGSAGSGAAPRDAVPLPPAAIPEPVAATPVVAVTAESKGMFLQLGAFGSQENADNYLARLRAQVDWLAPVLHVYPKDGLFRVHAGPYANPAEARIAADRISQALGIKTMVLAR